MVRPSISQRSFFPHIRYIEPIAALAGLCVLLVACGGDSGAGTAAAELAPAHPATALAPASMADPPQQTARASPDTAFAKAAPLLPDPIAPASTDGPYGQDPNAYVLTFYDSFDGDLNLNVWNTQHNLSPDAVQNFATRNGVLKIWPERGKNGAFFNRTLDTEGHFVQRYGYFEIEAKLPRGKGVWPAFWLYTTVGGVHREIDIMEAYAGGLPPWSKTGPDGIPTAVMYAPVVWTRSEEATGYAKVPTPDLSAAFYRFGAKWEPDRITFYFDGRQVLVVNASISEPLYMLVDLYFGGDSGEPDEKTPVGESNSLEVNYVKAWQFK